MSVKNWPFKFLLFAWKWGECQLWQFPSPSCSSPQAAFQTILQCAPAPCPDSPEYVFARVWVAGGNANVALFLLACLSISGRGTRNATPMVCAFQGETNWVVVVVGNSCKGGTCQKMVYVLISKASLVLLVGFVTIAWFVLALLHNGYRHLCLYCLFHGRIGSPPPHPTPLWLLVSPSDTSAPAQRQRTKANRFGLHIFDRNAHCVC